VKTGKAIAFNEGETSTGNIRLLGNGKCEILGKRAVEDDTSGELYWPHRATCEVAIADRGPKDDRAATHTCHANGCSTRVPPKMFMCAKHWRQLPQHLKDAIWETYRDGQEERMDPSDAYLKAALKAVDWMKAFEAGQRARQKAKDQPKPEQGQLL